MHELISLLRDDMGWLYESTDWVIAKTWDLRNNHLHRAESVRILQRALDAVRIGIGVIYTSQQ